MHGNALQSPGFWMSMALVWEEGFGAAMYGQLSGTWDLVWDTVLGVPVCYWVRDAPRKVQTLMEAA